MITIDIKSEDAYKKIIGLAKKDDKFKACGNLDNMWIILKFETNEQFLEWLSKTE